MRNIPRTTADCARACVSGRGVPTDPRAWLAEESFDVAFLDDKFPDTNGFEIFRRIQRDQPDTAVIMITAHSNVENATEAIKSGATRNAFS